MNDKSLGAAAMFFSVMSAMFFIGSLTFAWVNDGPMMVCSVIVTCLTLAVAIIAWKE